MTIGGCGTMSGQESLSSSDNKDHGRVTLPNRLFLCFDAWMKNVVCGVISWCYGGNLKNDDIQGNQ